MNPRYGIDTSILVRLVSGDPEELYGQCVQRLSVLVQEQGAEVFASNQVIGEAYIALQHHYGITKSDARDGLASVLQSGLVAPQHGQGILDILATGAGCGLIDRLIADDYRRDGLASLTLGRKMAGLDHARLL